MSVACASTSVRTRGLVAALVLIAGLVGITTPALAAAPANDDFASAQSVTTFPVSGTSVEATMQTNEYADAGNAFGQSVWFTYTPSTSGLLKLDTCDSDYDTVLVVWENPLALPTTSDTPTASNDDAGYPGCGLSEPENYLGSQVTVAVTAGTAYYIQVGAFLGEGNEDGTFNLEAEYVTAAGNNDFDNAITFSGSSVSGSNFAATLQTGEYDVGGELQNSVWFRFTATESGSVDLNTCDAEFDSILIVWKDPSSLPLAADTPLAENDDSASCASQNPLGSAVSFSVTRGSTYYVQIGNFTPQIGINQGIFTLSAVTPRASETDQTPPAWLQSIGRPADGTCLTEQGWLPTWEQWMNDGLGGETCYRVIAWNNDGWAVGNWGGPNGTFVAVAGASIDGSTPASGSGRTGGKSNKK